jgi:hypothetical protein
MAENRGDNLTESGHQSRQRNPCIASNNTMLILSQNNDAANSQIYPDPPDNGNSSQFGSEYLDSTAQDSAYFSRLSSANDHQPPNRNTNETQLTPKIDRAFVEKIASEKFKIGQLKDEQWDIVHSVVKKRRDTILNAATVFGSGRV